MDGVAGRVGKAVLVVSDMHFGDGAQYYASLSECMARAIREIRSRDPVEVEVVINGDAVAGRGIFRSQEVQNIVQLGSEQAWWCAWTIRGWQQELRASRWVVVLGNHDHTHKENLAQQLVILLRLLGVPAVFGGRSYVGNFALDDREGCWFQAEHGFGVSSYYANSYAEIRAVWRKFIEHAVVDNLVISRFLRAHVHWLNIGQAVGMEVAIDTTGGWHRQERLSLPSDVRNTGMLLYWHDGERLQIEPIEASRELLMEESRSAGLHYRNLEEAARAMQELTEWAWGQGLCG